VCSRAARGDWHGTTPREIADAWARERLYRQKPCLCLPPADAQGDGETGRRRRTHGRGRNLSIIGWPATHAGTNHAGEEDLADDHTMGAPGLGFGLGLGRLRLRLLLHFISVTSCSEYLPRDG
jgi:hypothetical protein